MTELERATGEAIIAEMCAAAGVPAWRVRSIQRKADVVQLRREIVRRLRFEVCLKWADIGRLINRDHASVICIIYGKRRRGPMPTGAETTCEVGGLS